MQADLSTVFDGLNVLGRVPWRINKFVLEVAQRCWRDNIPLGDIPSRSDHSVPPKPIRPERTTGQLKPDSEEVKAANAEFRAYKEALIRHHRFRQKNMVCIQPCLIWSRFSSRGLTNFPSLFSRICDRFDVRQF